MIMKNYTDKDLAAAYVRGEGRKRDIDLPEELQTVPLGELTDDQKDELVILGKKAELKMHYFKEKDELARVRLIDLFESYGASVRIVYLETDLETQLRRNAGREDKVPEKTLDAFLRKLSVPEVHEARKVEWYCV